MKKSLVVTISLISLIVGSQSFGQAPRIKDDPAKRVEFEIRKLRNPLTGRIPENIRTKELAFASEQPFKERNRENEATSWTHRGPFNVGGRTRALAVDVNNEDILLAGGVSGGVWLSTDAGLTWSKTTSVSDLQSITCIAQDPRKGLTKNTWYYGTGERRGNSASGSSVAYYSGDGIFKSTNGGLSWSILPSTSTGKPQINDQCFDYVHEIVVNPTNGDVFVATECGIFKSQDEGMSFKMVLTAENSTDSEDAPKGWTDIQVTSTGVLYAHVASRGGGIYKSDGGPSWTKVSEGSGLPVGMHERKRIGIAPSDEDIVYVIGEESLWKYDDNTGGVAIWTDLSGNLPKIGNNVLGNFNSQGGYNLLVEVKPGDENFVIIGGTNLYRSTDGFTTTGNTRWIGGYSPPGLSGDNYPSHHPDQHVFLFLSGTKALSGNDGGVQRTNDITAKGFRGSKPVNWVALNNGYLTTQVYALSTGPGDQILAGFQDNGTWLTTSLSSKASWSTSFGGDGAYNAWSHDGTTRYLSTQYANISRGTYSDANEKRSVQFIQISPFIDRYFTSLFITPFYLDPLNDEILYLGGHRRLFVNTQASSSTRRAGWKSITLGSHGGIVSEIGLTGANMVYVGTANGALYKVKNPAEDFLSVSTNLALGSGFPPRGYISSIGVNPFDENELIVTFSNYEVISIFHSTNGGTSWTDISGNLEENVDGSGNGPSVRIARILRDGRRYLVGTSTGLYSTQTIDGTHTVWTQEGSNTIGNVVVSHMAVRNDDGLIVIGTHGNGLYSASIVKNTDLQVNSIDAPFSMDFQGPSDITVTLSSTGRLPIASFDISLSVNGKRVVTDNVDQVINSRESYQHTFSAQYDFTALGSYELGIVATIAGDENPSNNTKNATITSFANPTDITLSIRAIEEKVVAGTTIGRFNTTDEDDIQHAYSLVAGEGDDDNASFAVDLDDLSSAVSFDFETQADYVIRVQTEDDDGNAFAKSFSINVLGVTSVEDLEDIGITMYPNPFKNRISLEMVNDYLGEIEILVLSPDGKNVIVEKSYVKKAKETRSLLDLQGLVPGNYIVKFNMGGKIISSKLIKE